MRKLIVFSVITAIVALFSYCNSPKKAKASAPPAVAKVTYEGNIKPLIAGKCTPCHIPANGGNKKAYDNYTAAKSDIDAMVHRVELNPTDKGFMPFHKAKLSDSTVAVFKQWKTDGLLEK